MRTNESAPGQGVAAGHERLGSSALALRENYDAALLDLDGVVYRGPSAVDHAADALIQARGEGLKTFFVTNNASRTPQMVADHLRSFDIPATAEEIATAAQAAARLVIKKFGQGTTVLPIGGEGLTVALTEAGLTVVSSADDRPDVVVQGFDKTLGWSDLAEATYAIGAGAAYIASNTDSTLPTERGIALGNGSLVAAVEHATGVGALCAGKPQPEIFDWAQRQAGAARAIAVGDRLNTDIAGGNAAGIDTLHVLTGVDGVQELLRAIPAERPKFLGKDLRALNEPHPVVKLDGRANARCGTAHAHWNGTDVEIGSGDIWRGLAAGGQITLDELRASCVLAWAIADSNPNKNVLPATYSTATVS